MVKPGSGSGLSKRAFFSHKQHVEQGPRRVTRASAVFYFTTIIAGSHVETELHYMNYWKEKVGLEVLERRLTFRDMNGEVLLVDSFSVCTQGSFVIAVKDYLPRLSKLVDEGSVEIEFISEAGMVMAYPAVVVRYVGQDWHTLAHSCQRFYSESSGDQDCDSVQIVEEGNVTLHNDPGVRPFLLVHNGERSVGPRAIEVSIFTEDGRVKTFESRPMTWGSFQSRRLYLDDLVEFRDFLGDKRGTYSICLNLAGVFPRLIAGHERRGVWSIDHTNFAATSGPAVLDVVPVKDDDAYRELVFSVPSNPDQDWKCFVDIYPTYPEDSGYWIDVEAVDEEGTSQKVSTVQLSRSAGEMIPRISISNDLLSARKQVVMSYRHATFLPRRFHTGIHYQIGNGMPGFLTDGPMPTSTPGTRTRWLPIFDLVENHNILMLSNTQPDQRAIAPAVFNCKLFNAEADDPLLGQIEVGPYQQVCLSVTEIFGPKTRQFLGDGPGWIYMVAQEPQRVVVHYASLRGEESIAVCHAF